VKWGFTVRVNDMYLGFTQATLALGTATAKSVLQCNVGKRSPVYLCALYPVNSESLQLNLEFEEADDVVFSVIGPRSVFLTGYYLRSVGHELYPFAGLDFGVCMLFMVWNFATKLLLLVN
jgi:hypothetical protein